uniref:Uncharacterized protein n=1 Tax=Cacopsylla melanoneura TaxID=428564 RepID=A0A8D8LIK8_9HEMI
MRQIQQVIVLFFQLFLGISHFNEFFFVVFFVCNHLFDFFVLLAECHFEFVFLTDDRFYCFLVVLEQGFQLGKLLVCIAQFIYSYSLLFQLIAEFVTIDFQFFNNTV